MRKIIFLWVALLSVGVMQAQVRFETGSTDRVRALAQKSERLVFIDLYADWCQPCRIMQRDVFSREDVGAFVTPRFVAAKYNIDQSTGRDLLKKYGHGAIPLYLVFDTQGNLLGRIEGACNPRTLIENLKTILAAQK